ncbi:DUF938 domain-containing protein [Methylomicrobium sp. Wu6]|uniref:DUF938 domain-containing protein n=1 Tax=Methylomicrobium sp. Wu6 TaxID=3107928 RepID=UPI002DD61B6A|nr:DUF938 domain-containing protein [Methylomicrobium sp. Wu6]MEC4749842.1 DUF938 domain-containing protein [Methylomicrobium sp. Wu6]
MRDDAPPLNPHPLSEYIAWAGVRNREPILGILKEKLPKAPGRVLELGSGSGMHINYFAPYFGHLYFHPSDKNEEVFDNIKKLRIDHANYNVADPVHLDLTDPHTWLNPGQANTFDAIFSINIFQVAQFSIADGMMDCASQLLTDEGILLVYGTFKTEGSFSADSNKEIHHLLSSAGVAEWELKEVADLKNTAAKYNMALKEQITMPANNFSLIFGKRQP